MAQHNRARGAHGTVGPDLTRRRALQAGAVGFAALAWAGASRTPWARAAPAPVGPAVYVFNQNWLFGGVYRPGAEATGASEAGYAPVTLPHTVVPLSWGDWDHTAWEKVWIYRAHLDGSLVSGRRVLLHFDGVMTSATVYLNGARVAHHDGGYLPWSVELTGGLNAGDNVIAVTVDGTWLDVPPDGNSNGAPAVDYLQPAGIYRDVSLQVTPQVFVADVFAKPTNVLGAHPGVDVAVTVDAADVPSGPVSVHCAILDGSRQLGSVDGQLTVVRPGSTTATVSISGLSGIELWSPTAPKLYDVQATIVSDGVSHSATVRTGFRVAHFANDGFYLNGAKLAIFGLNRHQLFPYTGMGAPARLQRRDAELLRSELNCNMVRCSHYPPYPDFLDACDELGLMVWEEPPGWQYVGDSAFQALVLQNVHDMVVRDRNRPSVIVWATRLNETGNYPGLYAQARQLAYDLDGTRQTTGAMTNQNDASGNWAEDVFAYDDYDSDSNKQNAFLKPPVSGYPYLVSESVGALAGAPLYRWIDTEATLATQARMHAQVHSIAQSTAGYAGLLAWAGIDYASLNGGDRIWHNIKWPGVLDTFRVPKPGAAVYRAQLDPAAGPVIVPVFFWDFGAQSPAGGPGPGTMLATNCDRLELSVGGTHLTSGTPDTTDYPGLAHPPVLVNLSVSRTGSPELRVDGYIGQQLVATLLMSSDTSRDQLQLTLDDDSVAGDGSDMTRFTLHVVDTYGNHRPYPAGDVALALAGPADLLSENPFPLQSLGGVGGGFIRTRAGSSGQVTLTASHPPLGQASARLAVTPAPSVDFRTAGTTPPPEGPGGGVSSPVSSAPPPTPSPPRPVHGGPTRAQIRAALLRLLTPRGRPARIAALLHRSSYAVRFTAPSTGKLEIDWYRVVAGRHHRRQRILVASARVSVKRAGTVTARVRLTRRGRALLRNAPSLRLTADARFTAIGQPTVQVSRPFVLRR